MQGIPYCTQKGLLEDASFRLPLCLSSYIKTKHTKQLTKYTVFWRDLWTFYQAENSNKTARKLMEKLMEDADHATVSPLGKQNTSEYR